METDAYRLEVSSTQPMARLVPAGADPMRLMLLAALDTDGGADGTLRVAPPTVEHADGAAVLTLETTSTVWDSKRVRLRCTGGRSRIAAASIAGASTTSGPEQSKDQRKSRRALHPEPPRRMIPGSEPESNEAV